MKRVRRIALWMAQVSSIGCFAIAVHAADVVLVSPLVDRNDRLDQIFASIAPSVSVQRIGLERVESPQKWSRAFGERDPVQFSGVKLVVLENAHRNALAEIPVDGGGMLLDALADWVREGGHLLVVGGDPSFETYRESSLARVLPVVIAADASGGSFRHAKRRNLSGRHADGRYVEHLHPVVRTQGEVLIRAGSEPFAVRRAVGSGWVVAVLSGTQELLKPDRAQRDEAAFFDSPDWPEFVLEVTQSALSRSGSLGKIPDPNDLALPASRVGARIRSEYWFPGSARGRLSLKEPRGQVAWIGRADGNGWYTLPSDLRPGVYRAVWRLGDQLLERDVRIGWKADPTEFDIRVFSLSHGPYPDGLAPGEAYARARELADVGITSVVFAARSPRNTETQRDSRAMREIISAGLEIVYYRSLRVNSYFNADKPSWPFSGRRPAIANGLDDEPVGWDVHDDAFRSGVDQMLDAAGEIRALPSIRALQVIEEFRDGGMDSPSLLGEMKANGLSGHERPGDPGWFLEQEIRSRATGETFQRFRRMANRFLPGVPLSSYWPGSYWGNVERYNLRIPEFARAIDEFLGPGYGYREGDPDAGWTSVARTAAEIFAAHGHELSEGKGTAVYALGRDRGGVPGSANERTWRDTDWTALAHGATMLAYFDLARGEVLRPLGPLHDEFFRIGPWIAAAPRRPAGLAILASWTTRTAGTPDERRLHQTCLSSLHRSLALGFEDVDFLLEEQLARPPAELRAIIVSEAPLLTPETIANLNRFVVDGGILLLGSRVGISSPTGDRYDDPWKQARSTGRVHDLDTGWHCQVGPDELSADLAKYDLEPESRTLEAGTEARFRGDSEILYWFLLNHDEEPATVSSIAHLDAQQFFWKDLLTGKPVVIGTGSPARYRTRVESSEAAVLIGVKRPAASMAVKANVTPTHVEIDAALFDSGGAPVADGYPARLTVNDESGASLILPKAQSRVARSGRIRWSVAIPVTSASGKLFFQVDEPISSMSRSGEVALSSPKSTISTEAVE